jgi:hypothetical protein
MPAKKKPVRSVIESVPSTAQMHIGQLEPGEADHLPAIADAATQFAHRLHVLWLAMKEVVYGDGQCTALRETAYALCIDAENIGERLQNLCSANADKAVAK